MNRTTGDHDDVPAIPPTQITYDWPRDGIDPFELGDDRTHWFLRTTEHRPWGRAWPGGDFRDFGSYGEFIDLVPMGYRGILAYERLGIVLGGVLLQRWPETDTPAVVSSLWRSPSPYTTVPQTPLPKQPEGHEPPAGSLDDAIRATVARSTRFPEIPMITARCLRHESWH